MAWQYHGFTGSGVENIEVYIDTNRKLYMIGIVTNGRMWNELRRLWKVNRAYWDVALRKDIGSEFGRRTEGSLCVYARVPTGSKPTFQMQLNTVGKGKATTQPIVGGYSYSKYAQVFATTELKGVIVQTLKGIDHHTVQSIRTCLRGASASVWNEHKTALLAWSWKLYVKNWPRSSLAETVSNFDKWWTTKTKRP